MPWSSSDSVNTTRNFIDRNLCFATLHIQGHHLGRALESWFCECSTCSQSSHTAPGGLLCKVLDSLGVWPTRSFLPKQDRADDFHLENQTTGPAFTPCLAPVQDSWRQRTSNGRARGPEPWQPQLGSAWFQLIPSANDKTQSPEGSRDLLKVTQKASSRARAKKSSPPPDSELRWPLFFSGKYCFSTQFGILSPLQTSNEGPLLRPTPTQS